MEMPNHPKIAVTINLRARAGKESDLADLLSGAAELVKKTEPKTLYWFATQTGPDTFVINDGFAEEAGIGEHFRGQVAAALKARAGELVVGGWEQGVLPNVRQSTILSMIR